MVDRQRFRRVASLRLRVTLAATVVVGIALVLGAAIFATLLRESLVEGVRASAEADASSLAQQVDDAGISVISRDDDDDQFFQLLSDSGSVLVQSEDLEATSAIVSPDSDDATIVHLPDEDAEFITVTEDTDGDITIVAGRSLEDVAETLATVGQLLVVAVPLLVALIAVTSWLIVGRALKTVERMRREVDEVTATRLDRRVADPGSDDEISRLAQTMNRMLDRLDVAQRTQRQFLSDASHELKSPLASLRQFAEVAQSYPDRVNARDLSAAVLDEGARLERLVQSMLTLARADEQALIPALQAVDVDDLVLADATRLRTSGALHIDASAVGAARACGDKGLLAQVVRNLVDNASRHAKSKISLSLSEQGDTVLLTVDDDGSGIAQADRERVFERFVRLDEARDRESGGSGLGLSIVHEIVRAHGGSVRIDDSPLGGARIEVRLPRASDSPS